MALTRWGFIYTLGADADSNVVTEIGSPGCVLIAVGVPSDGAQLVELCGAFA